VDKLNIYDSNHHSYQIARMIIDNNYKRFAEVGIWQCRTLSRILKSNASDQIEEYWAIDNFDHVESGYHRELSKEVWDSAYAQACGHMIHNQSLKVLRMKSVDACKLFENEYLDMVFIDASHDYDAVVEDIKCWEPKIKKGGIISGHDYIKKKWGVNKAVNDIYKKEEIKELPGAMWYVNL